MKRFIAACLCALVGFTFCSCSNSNKIKHKYISQEIESVNYNNVSARTCNVWLDNNGVYYCSHDFFFNVYSITSKGRSRIRSLSYGCDLISLDGKLYMYESKAGTKFNFIEYDLIKETSTVIATIKAEIIEYYYVTDDYLYVVSRTSESLQNNLVIYSLNTKKTIKTVENIFSCGIVGDELLYVMNCANKYEIHKYNSLSDTSTSIGSFEYKLNEYEELESSDVNYTSNKIVFRYHKYDGKTETSKLVIYQLDDGAIIEFEPTNYISNIIAYDRYAFIVTIKNNNPNNVDYTSTLYRLNLDTLEFYEISTFNDHIDLFVTSDEDVYVMSNKIYDLTYYDINGTNTKIIQ